MTSRSGLADTVLDPAPAASVGGEAVFSGRVLDEDRGLILTHRILVTRLCNPLREQPWGAATFTVREVHQHLQAITSAPNGASAPQQWCVEHGNPADRAPVEPLTRTPCRHCEIARVAEIAADLRALEVPQTLDEATTCAQDLLALAPEAHPITLDVGLGGFWPPWLISDGNHRVAAATLINWPWLVVEIAGDWDRSIALFVDGTPLVDLLEAGL